MSCCSLIVANCSATPQRARATETEDSDSYYYNTEATAAASTPNSATSVAATSAAVGERAALLSYRRKTRGRQGGEAAGLDGAELSLPALRLLNLQTQLKTSKRGRGRVWVEKERRVYLR